MYGFSDQEEEPLYCRYKAGPDPTADWKSLSLLFFYTTATISPATWHSRNIVVIHLPFTRFQSYAKLTNLPYKQEVIIAFSSNSPRKKNEGIFQYLPLCL